MLNWLFVACCFVLGNAGVRIAWWPISHHLRNCLASNEPGVDAGAAAIRRERTATTTDLSGFRQV